MGLDASVQYHAYDIHEPRIALINHYFRLMGLDPLGEVRDVLVQPPQVQADLALLFKEAHRMEQRRRGCSRPLWEALKVRYLAVSLPAHSLSGRFDLVQRQRSLVSGIIGDLPWQCSELILGGEMVFIIDKQGSGGLV
jgi:16S rRNA (guanine(1405)-N(7))-methyltransferase